MANKDWFYDQFEVEQKGGEFDLSAAQTSELDAAGLDRKTRARWESDFIDDLYGTKNARTIIDGENRELSQDEWTATRYDDKALIASDRADVTMGLDLRREAYTDGDLEIGSPEHYQHLTTGPIDYADYENDLEFQKAFNRMSRDKGSDAKDAWNEYGSPGSIGFLTDDDWSPQQKVSFIRDAKLQLGRSETDEESDFEKGWTDWDSKFVRTDYDKIKPYKQEFLFDTGAKEITDRLVDAAGKKMTIRTDISNPTEIPKIKVSRYVDFDGQQPVKRPSNIPKHWGSGGDSGPPTTTQSE